jgi:hypothetical protein
LVLEETDNLGPHWNTAIGVAVADNVHPMLGSAEKNVDPRYLLVIVLMHHTKELVLMKEHVHHVTSYDET